MKKLASIAHAMYNDHVMLTGKSAIYSYQLFILIRYYPKQAPNIVTLRTLAYLARK